ncbi:transporter, partial [Streptomyces sp. CHB19.2]|nr:transporter [Streptomyces sp. CHB19.2]
DSGFEVSSSFQADFNSRNPATDYRSGTEYRHEFAVGQHLGPWTLGLGGYYYRQLTDDDAPGLTRGNRARVLALGPAL